MAVSGWAQPRPSLNRVVRQLSLPVTGRAATGGLEWVQDAVATRVVEPLAGRLPIMVNDEDLRLIGKSAQQQVVAMIAALVIGFLAPGVLLGGAQILGVVHLAAYVPAALMLAGGAVLPLLVHRQAVDRATQIRSDLRYQLSAFLDVVTMLLAGNTGHEGALSKAARAGDGRLFIELTHAMREAAASGRSLVVALEETGSGLGLVELRQVASTVSLSAAEGSPVARTLAAKCATLRSTLASEQETDARLRTSRLTTPLVGMGLIFMALVIYPALQM
jgi:tight adherence protein C